jgi:hypothetical protein
MSRSIQRAFLRQLLFWSRLKIEPGEAQRYAAHLQNVVTERSPDPFGDKPD